MTTALIVEDNPINVRVFTRMLIRLGGLEVTHTENVEEVLMLAKSGTVDIILMDISLANSSYQGKSMDGIKITQLLKANPVTAKLPIILVTAHSMLGDRENFLKASNADEYITKPVIDPQEFVEKILSFLS